MSLTVSLQTTAGASSAVVTNGQVLTLDVVATVAGVDGTATYDGLQDVEGSFLSTAVGTSAVAGNLVVTGAVAPFDALGSAPGTAQDLNGDGNIDVGSDVLTSSAVGDYFFARAGSLDTGGVVSGANTSFTIATVTYTVTATNDGGPTDIAFRPRDTSQVPGTVAAVWTDSSAGTSDQDTGTFQAGAPFQVTAAPSTGTVTASVYDDANGDGARDAGEGPVAAGTTVYLDVGGMGTYSSADPSGLTDDTGTATIANVMPGTYAVRVVPPTGFTQSAPAADGAESATVTAGATTAVAPFGVEMYGSVSGTVYVDNNGDGTQEVGEPGLAGVTVYIDLHGNGIDDFGDPSTTTDSDGTYTLGDVAAGPYTLRVQPPAGNTATTASSYALEVAPGAAVTAEPFGLTAAGSISGTATAGTTVYLDANGNGILDAGDASTVAATDGTYAFANLSPGAYTVRTLVPLGDVVTTPATGDYALTVAPGETDAGTDFTVVTLPAAALTVSVESKPAAAVIAGATGTLKVRVNNGGDAAFAGQVGLEIYAYVTATQISPGTFLYMPDLAIGAATKTLKLKAGKSAVVAVKYAYPLTLASGTYHLLADASSGATTAPALGGAPGAVAVTATMVALSPTIVAAAAGVAVKPGKAGAVNVRIANAGNVTAIGTAAVTLYATTTGTVDATAIVIGSAPATKVKVAARKAATLRVTFTAPAAMAAGSYQLITVLSAVTTPVDTGTVNTSAAVATR